MKLVDAHCHLDHYKFDHDREEVIKRNKRKIEFLVTSGVDVASNKITLQLAKDNDFIYPALGLAPTMPQQFDVILDMLKKEDYTAIGEVGLDYYWEKNPKKQEEQRTIFSMFVDLANQLDKPLVIHCRDAFDDCFKILEHNTPNNVIFHCFSGDENDLARAKDNGFFVSMATNINFSKAHAKLINQLPLEYTLTETDSPYLCPDRGKRNEPFFVQQSVELISSITEQSVDVVSDQVYRNALTAFRIKR